MNQVQEAIARVTGLDGQFDSMRSEMGDMADVMEHLISDNAMLQRQIEDLDYLNIYETNPRAGEILPLANREKTLLRLRRLRQDNPLAKQAVKLIVRFTLGKGVQWVLAAEKDTSVTVVPGEVTPPSGNDVNPTAPGTDPSPAPPTKFVQLPRTPRTPRSVVQADQVDPIRDILAEFWSDPENTLSLTSHKAMQQMLDDVVVDGEKFFACFESGTTPHLKITEIPLEEITMIIYNPQNRLQPVYYRRQYQPMKYDGKSEQYAPDGNPRSEYYLDYRITDEMLAEINGISIPTKKINTDSKIYHLMVNEIWTRGGKRGVSELYSSREWFKVFRDFMEGRAGINAAAQAISYVRKIKGGPTAVASFQGKFGGLSVGDSPENQGSDLRKLTKPLPGSVYNANEAVDLEWMKTDTGALDAKEDARLLLMSAGAGVGTMVHYFGEGGDANLATAQSMELPMVKSYEDWQQFIQEFYLDLFKYLLRVANTPEVANKEITRVGFTFPPIISQDVVKFTTSWSQIVRDIAPNIPPIKREAIRSVLSIMGVANIDGLMPEIEAEMAQAEIQKQHQQALMAAALTSGAAQPPQPPQPPQLQNGHKPPTSAVDPNLAHLIAGKGEKISAGPKPA